MWIKHFVIGIWTQAIVLSCGDCMEGLMPLSLKWLQISGADDGEEELDVKQEQEEKSRLYILPLLLPALMTYDDAKKKNSCSFSCAAAHTLGLGNGGSER